MNILTNCVDVEDDEDFLICRDYLIYKKISKCRKRTKKI